MDAMLLAACVPRFFSGLAADYGAGNGAAGMAVLQACEGSSMDFIERDEKLCALMKAAAEHPKNAHLGQRMNIICADVADTKPMRAAVDRPYGCYDAIIVNPPYNDASHRTSPNKSRAQAHMMGEGGFDLWVKSANTMLGAKGVLAMIIRPANLVELLNALEGRFGAVRVKPIHPKADSPANRMLVTAQKGSRTPTAFLPPLVVHHPDGQFMERAGEIFRGQVGIEMFT